MSISYIPYEKRIPDSQYQDRLKFILEHGVLVKETPQGVGAITCFGELAPMVFDLSNGVPLITERKMAWRKPIAEITAFVNGARTIDEINAYGCNFWDDYRGKGTGFGLEPDDLGPGSYGAAFHDFPMTDGGTFNQFEHLITQIKQYAGMRTHLVTPWIPFYTGRGENRKVVVAPCHGWVHCRVFGNALCLLMWQRSADFPIGVPNNMIQYAALLLMVAKATGLRPWKFIHQFGDAHVYEDQIDSVRELIKRKPFVFPTLHLNASVSDFFSVRVEHFTLQEREAHPAISIPYRP